MGCLQRALKAPSDGRGGGNDPAQLSRAERWQTEALGYTLCAPSLETFTHLKGKLKCWEVFEAPAEHCSLRSCTTFSPCWCSNLYTTCTTLLCLHFINVACLGTSWSQKCTVTPSCQGRQWWVLDKLFPTQELQIQLQTSWHNMSQKPSWKSTCAELTYSLNPGVTALQKPRAVFSESNPSAPTSHKTNFYSLSACKALGWLNKCFPVWWTWELKISYYSCLQLCPSFQNNSEQEPERTITRIPLGELTCQWVW